MNRDSKLFGIAFILIAFIWVFVIGMDYINKHPLYELSWRHFKFPGLLAFSFIYSAAFSYLTLGLKGRVKGIVNGSSILLTIVIYLLMLCLSFVGYTDVNLTFAHILSFVGKNLSSLLFIFMVSFSAYCAGANILREKWHYVYQIGIGLVVITFMMFLLGVVGLINPVSMGILLLIPIIINIKAVPKVLKSIFINQWNIDGLTYLGLGAAIMLLFFLTINFSYIQLPFPTGFDSRNFYINISHLIGEQGALLEGFRPYNWSLFMSLGFSLFGSAEFTLSLSFLGMLLAGMAMLHLTTTVTGLSKNSAIWATLLIMVTPSIANQLFVELKTDLGLLYFQIIAVSLFIEIIRNKKFTALYTDSDKQGSKPMMIQLLILGIFLGFGMGIKLTNLFLVFGIVVAIFWAYNSMFGMMSIISAILFIALVGQLDGQSGLREYHLSINMLTIIFGIGAIGFGIFGMLRQKNRFLTSIIVSAVLAIGTISPMVPWVIKNYSETRSLSLDALLNGKAAGPNAKAFDISQKYKQSQGQ